MSIDIFIDKLTPCLEDLATGKILQTVFSLATDEDMKKLKENGWLFDWENEFARNASLVYKLSLKNDSAIQGLLSVEIKRGFVFVALTESAPNNRIGKQYAGVGGHLFAIAIKLSLSLGFGGYICMTAKNMDLVKHYAEMLGAKRVPTRLHEYQMEVLEEDAQRVIKEYTLEGDLNVV